MSRSDPNPPLERATLALPFAAIGLAGGYLASVYFSVDPLVTAGSSYRDNGLVGWLLLFVTPFSSAALGAVLAPRMRGSAPRIAAVASLWTIVAGIANGIVIGLIAFGPIGLIGGVIMGALSSLPFIPAVFLVLFAARHVGRARPRSVVDAADRRGVWRATAIAVALSGSVTATMWLERGPSLRMPPHPLVERFVLAALALVAALLVLDVIALRRARRATLALPELAPATLPPIAGEPGVVDFGVGEGASGLVRVPSYRSAEAVTALFLGDLRAAHRMLERAAAFGALAFLVVAVAAFACVQS